MSNLIGSHSIILYMSSIFIDVPDYACKRIHTHDELNSKNRTLIGRDVSNPHFVTVDGMDSTYHSLIVFKGEYKYDNIIIGTKGSNRIPYIERGSELHRLEGELLPLKTQNGQKTDFIVISRGNSDYLYHIPSGTKSTMRVRYKSVSRVKDGVFNIDGKDTHIIWNGSSFEHYEDEDIEKPDGKTEEIFDPNTGIEKEIQQMDMRKAYKYEQILDSIVRKVSIIKNKKEAKRMLNENIDFTNVEVDKRKLQDIKQDYITDKIDIEEFEVKFKQLINSSSELDASIDSELPDNEDIEIDKNEEEEDKLLSWN